MAEIVPFPSEADAAADALEDVSNDIFLLNEGLDLLADYRAIEDLGVRDSVRRLVRSLAQSSQRSPGSP